MTRKSNDKKRKLKELFIDDLGQVSGGKKGWPPVTTLEVGEEGGIHPTTLAIGEEDPLTTMAVGEEGVDF